MPLGKSSLGALVHQEQSDQQLLRIVLLLYVEQIRAVVDSKLVQLWLLFFKSLR